MESENRISACRLSQILHQRIQIEMWEWWIHPINTWLYIKNRVYPAIYSESFVISEPKVNIVHGIIETDISMKINIPKMYAGFMWLNSTWNEGEGDEQKTYAKLGYTVQTKAKRGAVQMDDYSVYNKSYIPDEAVEVVKEALAMGLEDIKVCYPSYGEGKIPDKDPIIIGYIHWESNGKKGSDMYMLAWFGYDAKNPMSCNI
jgi:hypothetical protein